MCIAGPDDSDGIPDFLVSTRYDCCDYPEEIHSTRNGRRLPVFVVPGEAVMGVSALAATTATVDAAVLAALQAAGQIGGGPPIDPMVRVGFLLGTMAM